MEKEYMKRLSQLIEMELDQLSTKGSLSPSEVCAAKEAVELLKEMKEYKEMCDDEMGYSERSGRGRMYSYNPDMYGYGWYAMDGGRYNNRQYSMDRGQYSGHSIKDRMIDRLERMVDEAQSEYERKEIMNEIAKLKQS